MISSVDPHIIAYPAIFVHDRIFDITTMTNAYSWQSMASCMINLIQRFEIIVTHQVTANDGGAISNSCADTNYTMLNPGCIDDAAFRDNGLFQCSPADLCGRQHAGAGVNGFGIIKKIELGYILRQSQVCFKE